MNKFNTLKYYSPLIIASLSAGLLVTGLLGIYDINNNTVQATGCPTQFVTEHIDNALKAYAEKNAEEVKNELDLAKQALEAAAKELE